MDPASSFLFPRAILHVDGDAFFASCETASRPWLRGKPVVTGRERGIATALSYEAKARGVKRGMRLSEIRAVCPDAAILSSDYPTYRIYARRMYAIVRRYAPLVEEYSVDECFADLSSLVPPPGQARDHAFYAGIAAAIQRDLHTELGITFSIGVSVNRVTAKMASKWKKPAGLTVVAADELPRYLSKLLLSQIWGIGPSTSLALRRLGIVTALDLVRRERHWVAANLSKPVRETYEELKGNFVHDVASGAGEDPASAASTGTFERPSMDRRFIFAELSAHAEEACAKLRRRGLVARSVSFFVKTQEFTYHGRDVELPSPTDMPQDLLRAIEPRFAEVFREGIPYRATGLTLRGLMHPERVTANLFGDSTAHAGTALRPVADSLDRLARIFGSGTVILASSLHPASSGPSGAVSAASISRKRFRIPFLGEVR